MSKKKRKSDNTWLRQALIDFLIGIILLLLGKLLD